MLLGVMALFAASTAAMYGGQVSDAEAAARAADPLAAADVDSLLERAGAVEEGLEEAELYVAEHVRPIERVLLDYRNDPVLVRRVARALVREANRTELDPRLLLAVLLVENPWLDPEASSFVGAVGLMQVMPLHRGHWEACEGPLENIETNICYGAQIFASYYRQEGNPERALLRYNGCVNGTNTPDCHRYPYHVYARAGRASILAWLSPRGIAAAP